MQSPYVLVTLRPLLSCRNVASSSLLAKCHYTDPTGPHRARPDKTRGLCPVVSGRARLVEFSYSSAWQLVSGDLNG